MEKHKTRQIIFIPIIMRRVDLAGTPFVVFKSLPGTDGDRDQWKPVTAWTDRDEAWWRVVRGIRQMVDYVSRSSRPR